MRAAIWVFVGSVTVLAVTLAIQHAVVPDIMPVSWNQEPQPTWGLELAFMLRAIENVAGMIAILVVLFVIARLVSGRFRRETDAP